jgi:hypothetical protein
MQQTTNTAGAAAPGGKMNAVDTLGTGLISGVVTAVSTGNTAAGSIVGLLSGALYVFGRVALPRIIDRIATRKEARRKKCNNCPTTAKAKEE